MKKRRIWLFIGITLLAYPMVSQCMEQRRQIGVISDYQRDMGRIDGRAVAKCLKEAEECNEILFRTGRFDVDGRHYDNQLNLLGNGMMGSMEIPRIDANLPIYHGTAEEVLAKGIGHLYGSSLPVGGLNTHSVLTGHRGLPSAELFTRLDEMKIGDLFFIHVCDTTLTYKVCEIAVIEPQNIEKLIIQEGRDLVSLVTCTPYGINTHRLVVIGERVPN